MYRINFILIIAFFMFGCGESVSTSEVQTTNDESNIKTNLSNEAEAAAAFENEVEATIDQDLVDEIQTKTEVATNRLDTKVKDKKSLKNPVVSNEESASNTTDQKVIVEKIDEPKPEVVKLKPSHDQWDVLLKKHVTSSGKVNYAAMKSDLKDLEAYVTYLESFASQDGWTRNERLAYWINLYNAATVRLICQNYPIASITNLNGGKPWDDKIVQVGLKAYTLNDIENKIIRPVFKDARIHFAVNCAAKSCPKIMNSAFTASALNRQLDKQTTSFINSSENNIQADKIEISKIFDWYGSDFESGNIIDFLNIYSNITINKDASIVFKAYNWDLNKQ